SPTKRRGNRRYYQRKEIILVRHIKDLLYNQGFTIEGARVKLSLEEKTNAAATPTVGHEVMQNLLAQLESILTELEFEL
ncbi:MAG: MerR family transcriptional regulator, partial [Gammaproteobacteria bacterium]|nr:MerR family transcriptional regulator [Gammaproteobacteria bacterium]